ncbi:MAG: hypothetical protein AB7J46_06470 [Candidatus Altimarinota bacterium]
MEVVVSILEVLRDYSPLGVAALAIAAAILVVWKNPIKPIQSQLDTITGNHLAHIEHDLPKLVQSVEKVADILQRIESKMEGEFGYIRAKLEK